MNKAAIINKINLIFQTSPLIKTIIFFFLVIFSGILCGTFLSEININGKLEWSIFYKTISFYIIIVYLILIFIYYRFIYKLEKNMLNFLDDDYCKAYIRSQCLPEIISKYKESIKYGKKPKDLVEYHKELEKILK